jgi:5-methylcytosine-specific restriction protein B
VTEPVPNWADAMRLLDRLFDIRSQLTPGDQKRAYRAQPNGPTLNIWRDSLGIHANVDNDMSLSIASLNQLEDYARNLGVSPSAVNAPPPVAHTFNTFMNLPLNTILYGPPGTGKTISTFARAVEICDGVLPASDIAIFRRYEELREDNRIVFVTFHQSYGYEEFVEGFRPARDANGQVAFELRPGPFRLACEAAKRKQWQVPGLSGKPIEERAVFKMSLGARRGLQGQEVFQYCLEHGCALLGWGDDVDFSERTDYQAIWDSARESGIDEGKLDSLSEYVNRFKHDVKIGDLIVVSDGAQAFRGIAEVTGDYAFLDDDRVDFHQMRRVKWLAVYEKGRPHEEIYKKQFAMASLFRLNPEWLNYPALKALLAEARQEDKAKPHVLIIDEINRANISKVFGELITLLEPDKRENGTYPVTLKLAHSGHDFSVPGNLYLLGTMNTADRSIAMLDTALRRRFDFEELMPDPRRLRGRVIEGIDLEALLMALNERIEALYDRDHTIGHGFFMHIGSLADLEQVFRRKVLPLLQEYFYDNWGNIVRALSDKEHNGDFIQRQVLKVPPSNDEGDADFERYAYRINTASFPVSAYLRLLARA